MGLYLIPPYSAYFGMRWQRFVGSLDRQVTEVSFAKESYKNWAILQDRPDDLGRLQIFATP